MTTTLAADHMNPDRQVPRSPEVVANERAQIARLAAEMRPRIPVTLPGLIRRLAGRWARS
jgi:hypothetical protein